MTIEKGLMFTAFDLNYKKVCTLEVQSISLIEDETGELIETAICKTYDGASNLPEYMDISIRNITKYTDTDACYTLLLDVLKDATI